MIEIALHESNVWIASNILHGYKTQLATIIATRGHAPQIKWCNETLTYSATMKVVVGALMLSENTADIQKFKDITFFTVEWAQVVERIKKGLPT